MDRREVRLDSVVVHVLTRDAALAAASYYLAMTDTAGVAVQLRGMTVESWVRMPDGWRMTGFVAISVETGRLDS